VNTGSLADPPGESVRDVHLQEDKHLHDLGWIRIADVDSRSLTKAHHVKSVAMALKQRKHHTKLASMMNRHGMADEVEAMRADGAGAGAAVPDGVSDLAGIDGLVEQAEANSSSTDHHVEMDVSGRIALNRGAWSVSSQCCTLRCRLRSMEPGATLKLPSGQVLPSYGFLLYSEKLFRRFDKLKGAVPGTHVVHDSSNSYILLSQSAEGLASLALQMLADIKRSNDDHQHEIHEKSCKGHKGGHALRSAAGYQVVANIAIVSGHVTVSAFGTSSTPHLFSALGSSVSRAIKLNRLQSGGKGSMAEGGAPNAIGSEAPIVIDRGCHDKIQEHGFQFLPFEWRDDHNHAQQQRALDRQLGRISPPDTYQLVRARGVLSMCAVLLRHLTVFASPLPFLFRFSSILFQLDGPRLLFEVITGISAISAPVRMPADVRMP